MLPLTLTLSPEGRGKYVWIFRGREIQIIYCIQAEEFL
jgi:hypothetical protein